MKSSIIFLLSLSLGITFLSAQNLPNSFIENPKEPAPKNGEIPLISNNQGGFYVHVDIINQNNKINNIPSTVTMIPAFYTSDTLLANDCFEFSHYNCDDYDCKIYEKSTTKVNYLNFRAEGDLARARVYLDYNNWDLYSFALIANECSSDGIKEIGLDTYGILGLGAEVGSDKSFIGSKTFWISLDDDMKNGRLSFNLNSNYSDSDKPVVTIPTDKNWQNHYIHAAGVGNEVAIIPATTVIFDLSTEAIRIPHYVYMLTQYFLNLKFNITCASPNESMPVCTINRRIKDLPDIVIYPDSGAFSLPPQLYVKDGLNDSVVLETVTLNFVVISSDTTKDFSYVLPEFDNYIILGNSFLRYYNTKFDVAKNQVMVFQKKEGGSPSSNTWIYIILGLILVGIIIFVVVKLLKPKRGDTERIEGDSQGSLLAK